MRTIKELALESLHIQDACNLSGVVHSFSRAMTDLREIARLEGWESTDKLNQHPIAILFAGKIADLTGSDIDLKFSQSWNFVHDLVGNNV